MKGILFLSFFISFIVFLMSLSLFYYYFTPISNSPFQASVTFTENTGGFDLNSSALTFGSITLGGSSTRSILIDNSYPFPVRVKLSVQGPISDVISYSSIVIQPYMASSFKMTVSAGLNSSLGEYLGNVSVLLLRA